MRVWTLSFAAQAPTDTTSTIARDSMRLHSSGAKAHNLSRREVTSEAGEARKEGEEEDKNDEAPLESEVDY
jgi:hypothetical protein